MELYTSTSMVGRLTLLLSQNMPLEEPPEGTPNVNGEMGVMKMMNMAQRK